MSKDKATAILVAGMHRSGTSALTGALGAMGVDLGERLLAPGDDNPKGYWEHEDAVGIHERLLASLGRSWDDVRALPEGWQSSDAARVASSEIAELISRDFAQSALWAVKDPRICRFLPLWTAATKQLGIRPVVLFVARRPSEVAASIEARNHWAPPIGELLWLRHMFEAEAASRMLQRATVVYDDLLADPVLAVSDALKLLDVQHKGNDAAEHDALKRLIDAADRHHRHESARQPASSFGELAQAAYETFADIAHGKGAWHSLQDGADRLDAQWQASGATIEAVADMAHQIRLQEAAARLDALDFSSKLNAQIEWSEQAVAIRSEMRAEYQLAIEAIIVERERQAGELKLMTAQAEQERAEHDAERERLVAEQNRLVSELDAASALAEQERQAHELRARDWAEQHDAVVETLRATQGEVATLAAALTKVHQSLSWRTMQRLRAIAGLFRAKSTKGNDQRTG